jgi:hypothetical protein
VDGKEKAISAIPTTCTTYWGGVVFCRTGIERPLKKHASGIFLGRGRFPPACKITHPTGFLYIATKIYQLILYYKPRQNTLYLDSYAAKWYAMIGIMSIVIFQFRRNEK